MCFILDHLKRLLWELHAIMLHCIFFVDDVAVYNILKNSTTDIKMQNDLNSWVAGEVFGNSYV